MRKIADLHLRVIDKGLFLPIARRLARDVSLVTYWTPHERAFPTVKDFIGDGFDDVQRVESPWTDLRSVDAFVFPDIGFAPLQAQLVDLGIPVWGAGGADRLETSRAAFLQALQQVKLPVAPHQVVRGLTNLKDYLHEKQDIWVKLSRFRGDFETMHWRSREEDENRLDALAVRLGPFRELLNFYAFDAIKTDNEDGCDTWCIDGAYPKLVIHGMEAKDKAYLGTWQKYSDLPEELRTVTDAFAPLLGGFGYRGFFSTEVRITDQGESYFIDPTCRAGSPPSQVMTEMIGNYTEIIWAGAQGKLIEPEPAAKFGVQALIKVSRRPHEWASLKVTDEVDRFVKCPNAVRVDDCLWFPPDADASGEDVGWLVGIGDTCGEAIRYLQHNVKLLPDGATCDFAPLAELIQQIEKAEAAGMTFTEQEMPPPEIVVKK